MKWGWKVRRWRMGVEGEEWDKVTTVDIYQTSIP